MSASDDWIGRFITHLETLREGNDRGALAALRRGLGSPPGGAPSTYPHILPWAPQNRRGEDACYIIAPLFALHPEAGGAGNLGKAFSRVEDQSESLERRFVALLNCHREDLSYHLRQAVSLLKAKDVTIDWRQLLRDVLFWDHEERFVQQQWARDFWQRRVDESPVEGTSAGQLANSIEGGN